MLFPEILQIALVATGIINCFIIAVFLFSTQRGNIKANKILGFLLIAICIKISFGLLDIIRYKYETLSFIIYHYSKAAYLCFGPLLLVYIRTLQKKATKGFSIVLMLLPVLYPFIARHFHYRIPLWHLQAYFLIFLITILIQLKTYNSKIREDKYIKPDKLWVTAIFTSFVVIWLVVNLLLIQSKLYIIELLTTIIITFYINIYIAFKHYWLIQGDKTKPQKYKNSHLNEDEISNILGQLQKLMEAEKLYIDPEITLPKVAYRIGVKPYKLSQVINQKMDMTFNEFINSCRINDIQKLLKLPESQNVKIANLAFDYGFNSISVFNTAFKKFTNYTPSQFRNENIFNNHN